MLSRFSVKKPYTVVVAVVLVIILGVVSFMNMTTDLLPDMNLPYAVVITTYPGASPEEVEESVTRPVEQSMATVSNIENVSSVSSENMSMVILEFAQSTDMDSVSLEMRENLDQISGSFDDSVASPIIMKMSPDMMPVMVAAVGVSGKEGDGAAVADEVDKKVVPELESTEGVASVSSSGMVEESVQVVLREEKVEALNKKVKKEIDKKMDEAQDQIDSAKSKLSSGQAKLSSGTETAADKLSGAKSQLNDSKDEILKAEIQIDQQIASLEQQEAQLAKQEAQTKPQLTETVSQLQSQVDALNTQKTALETQKKAAEEQLNTPNLPAETLQQLTQQVSQLDESIKTIDTQIAQCEANIKTSQATLQQFSDSYAQIAGAKKQLNAAKSKVTSGKIPVSEALKEVEKQQITTSVELGSASANISSGQSQIEKSEAELENSKDSAYEQADLSNILTTDMIKNILTAQNFSMPAGYVSEDGVDYLVRVGDKPSDVEGLADMVLIDMDGVDDVRLSDVADVSVISNADEVYAKVNGEPGVLLSIQKQTGYSTGTVSDNLSDKFGEIEAENEDVEITALMDQGIYIDMVVDSVLQNLVFGAILAVLVLILFLRSLRPTLIIACSIPLSIMTAIVLMYFSGVTLNVISLSGLALGVGMLVDNSIVVIENIYRMRGEGMSAKQAAVEGAKQVSGAIAASTLTTVCVFLPIVFTEGITRQLFVDMGLTIAYALLASLLVALTLVPMMSAGLLEKKQKEEFSFFGKLRNGYAKVLGAALSHKFITLGIALALFVVSIAAATSRGTSFIPDMDSTQMSATVTADEGSTLSETGALADEAMEEIRKIDEVESVGAMAGGSSILGGSSGNEVSMYITLKEDKSRDNEAIRKDILERTKDIGCELEVSASTMDMSALGASGISIEIKGSDTDKLQSIAKDVAKIVEDTEGTTEVSDGIEETTEELRVKVDEAKAMEHGLTKAQVYQQVAAKVADASEATTLKTDEKDYGVYVTTGESEEMSRDDVKKMKLSVTDAEGKTGEVAISDVATFETGEGLDSIRRDAQTRYVNVTAAIDDGYNIGLVADDVQDKLDEYELPKGYSLEMTGEDETIGEAMFEVIKMLALAVVFMYLIMVAQFQSLLSPFIIMFTIPLAFTGGLFGLYFTGNEISIIAMIGFVMLSGIIVNNGIVFVDYANQLRRGGMEKREALIETGKTRLRPIVMTAITTILGLSTMAAGMGMGADLAQPMAIVTIGGLLYGTLLTLVVVPCIYDLLNRKKSMVEEEI